MKFIQRLIPYLIGFAFLISIGFIVFCADTNEWWKSNLGNLLTGTAACFSFILALFKLGPELEKWHKEKQADREQKKEDLKAKVTERNTKRSAKVAEVAEKLALATVDLIQAVRYITAVVALQGDPPSPDTSEMSELEKDQATAEHRRKMFYGRLDKKQKDLTRFYEAQNLARILLPKECYLKAEEISKELNSLFVDFDMHVMYLGQGDKRLSGNAEAYKAVFSTATKDKFSKLEEELLEMLRPLAQEYIEPE